MDYIRRFDIQLDREYVYPGQYLTGHVILDNRDNIKMRNIRATLRGRAHVEWKVMKSGERRTVKDDQYFLDDKMLIWGTEETEESIPILPRGHHQLPFRFFVPEAGTQVLPCSFESKAGNIRYYIKVTIDIPYASPPQGIKYFTVITPTIDCNEDKYMIPVIAQDVKVLCCFCCRRGPISLICTLPRTAYCSGEGLQVQCDVNNQSNESAQLRIQLYQYVEYFIDRGPLGVGKDIHHLVLQHIGSDIEPDSNFKFSSSPESSVIPTDTKETTSRLIIPVCPPTLIGMCRLIQMYYVLKICVVMKNSGEDLHMEFPITIGTKPARDRSLGVAPPLSYVEAADHVEGGMYISPEFQVGQVYDGSYAMAEGPGGVDEVILYSPVYVNVDSQKASSFPKQRNSYTLGSPVPSDHLPTTSRASTSRQI